MAHFRLLGVGDPLSWINCGAPDIIQLALWGGGPSMERLEIVISDPLVGNLVFPSELVSYPEPNLRVFEFVSSTPGRATIEAKLPRTGVSYAMPLSVTVGGLLPINAPASIINYYHATSLQNAKRLMGDSISPRSVPETQLLNPYEYTDFGKGFYTHPEGSRNKAIEWAKKRNPEWGVVRFSLTAQEFASISGTMLLFPDKFKTRPADAPKLFAGQPATWLEFVEFNRQLRTVNIARPKDNDWTNDFAMMRGPIWGPRDSALAVAPMLDERFHQINWGSNGLDALNSWNAKRRRFLITKHNERAVRIMALARGQF